MNVFRLHARSIALTIFLLLLTLLAGTALLGLAGHFLTAAALAGVTAMGFNFFGPSAGIRALTFVRILSRYAEKLVGHDVTLRLARDLRMDFFRSVLPLAPLGLGRHRVGELLARLVADIENVDGLLVRAVGPLLALSGLGLTAVVVTGLLLPSAGILLALVLLSLGVGIPYVIARSASNVETARAQARADLRTAVLEGLEGATDLAALEATGAWIEHIDAAIAQVARCERERKTRLSAGIALHAAVVAVSLPAMLWLLLEAAHGGRLSPAAAGGLFFMTVAVFEAAAGIGPGLAIAARRARFAAAPAAGRRADAAGDGRRDDPSHSPACGTGIPGSPFPLARRCARGVAGSESAHRSRTTYRTAAAIAVPARVRCWRWRCGCAIRKTDRCVMAASICVSSPRPTGTRRSRGCRRTRRCSPAACATICAWARRRPTMRACGRYCRR